MLRYIKFSVVVLVALLLQVTILPAYLADPFKPNLLLVVVVYLGLREPVIWGGASVVLLGLLADTFSGLYLGLSVFAFLTIYLLLRKAANRLYTDSGYLLVTLAAMASFLYGLLQILLILLFSVSGSIYVTILASLLPQALVNALAASFVVWFTPSEMPVEAATP